MTDKLIDTLTINDIEIKVYEDRYGYFYTTPSESILFLTSKIKYDYPKRVIYIYPITDDPNQGNLLPNKFENDEIQDIYIKNPLNLSEKLVKDYYLKYIFPDKPPNKLKFDYPIQEYSKIIYGNYNQIRLLDHINWNSCNDDSERLKYIQDITKSFYRKTAKAEAFRSFDCIGKISKSSVKEGLKLAKMLNTAGCDELYAKALLKYAETTPDTFEKILRDCSPKTICEVYPKIKDNIKKAFHSETLKLLPRMIIYVNTDFIKELESIDTVEWNLFGTEFAPDINLKYASIDVIIYLIDKIKVKNENEILNVQITNLNKMSDFTKKVEQIEKMAELVKKFNNIV